MLGLHCTESAIRAAAAKRTGKLLSVQMRAEQKLEKDIISGGTILDTEKLSEALKKLKTSLKNSNNSITLCLSPRIVYMHLLKIPKVRGSKMTTAVRGELEAVLPEELSDLTLYFTPVSREKGHVRIGVIAVRNDILSEYQTLLKEAGFSVKGVTTTAMALGDTLKHVDTFLLINAEDAEPSIVVFYGGIPVDEELLTSIAAQNVEKAAKTLLEEYKADNMPIQHVAVHGTKELYDKITKGLEPKKDKKAESKKEELEDTVTIEHVLPNLKKNDLSWGGIIVSGLGKGIDIRATNRISLLPIASALVLMGAIGYFLWSIGSEQILGLWRELQLLLP